VWEDVKLSTILTRAAFRNAVTTVLALGGSTNAIIHLIAMARRIGVELGLADFEELARRTPLLADIRPSGKYLMEDFFYAGGLPALLRNLGDLLDTTALTGNGRTLGENIERAKVFDEDVIRTRENPLVASDTLAVLHGNLAPDGAVIKPPAAEPRLHKHTGPAVVFDSYDEMAARIDDPGLPVDENSVLVLHNAGPQGAPGMPEWGQLPIPSKLLREGVSDMVRISDARMSGTSFGTVVLHVVPESAARGPLAVVRDGDPIELDVEARTLELAIPAEEIGARLAALPLAEPKYTRGYGRLFLDHVLQADEGCDFDFLRRRPGEPLEPDPLGLVGGPIGGW
jgi:dihydroxyacid dehydratase/phosphogluconate dehydratase